MTGEAYFQVAKDKEHPFVVVTGEAEIEALGLSLIHIYITLSSLNLSYQFDAGRLRHYGIERLKLSLIGNDVFRASTVKMERGTSYPFARNYSVALQVTF